MKCPCGFEGNKDDFLEAAVYCEDCGSHGALECPKCGRKHDLVYDEWCSEF